MKQRLTDGLLGGKFYSDPCEEYKRKFGRKDWEDGEDTYLVKVLSHFSHSSFPLAGVKI